MYEVIVSFYDVVRGESREATVGTFADKETAQKWAQSHYGSNWDVRKVE